MSAHLTNHTWSCIIDNEADMLSFGAKIGEHLANGTIVYISGDLGAGKTTLCRGILAGKSYTKKVKSPTYTLVESYQLSNTVLYHFDLYRLSDPDELEYIGYRDYLDGSAICLVEWPEKGLGWLPNPDLNIQITDYKQGRKINIQSLSKLGLAVNDNL